MLADEVELGENKAVIREGTRGREFFVVVEGVLRVTRTGRKVSDLGAGDFVGEARVGGGCATHGDGDGVDLRASACADAPGFS